MITAETAAFSPQPEREANATAIAATIASERRRPRRRRPGRRPREARRGRWRCVRCARGSWGTRVDCPVEAKLLPAPPPGAVELMVMVEVTVPFAGRVTVEVEKEQVGGSLGVPLPL